MSEELELMLEMLDEATRPQVSGRVCENCGYGDPNVCAMICPMCDFRHPGVGIRRE